MALHTDGPEVGSHRCKYTVNGEVVKWIEGKTAGNMDGKDVTGESQKSGLCQLLILNFSPHFQVVQVFFFFLFLKWQCIALKTLLDFCKIQRD